MDLLTFGAYAGTEPQWRRLPREVTLSSTMNGGTKKRFVCCDGMLF